jgi:hypothetical protein
LVASRQLQENENNKPAKQGAIIDKPLITPMLHKKDGKNLTKRYVR